MGVLKMDSFIVLLAFINIIATICMIGIILLIARDSGKFDDNINIFPQQTRQERFLKMYPNAKQIGDILDICPDKVYGHNTISMEDCAKCNNCYDCKEKFWLKVSKDEDFD